MGARLEAGLVGRREEQDRIAALLAGARSGQSGVLVIRGEAGIGKTALLSHMAAAASDFRVLHVCGSELEMEFPYAGVQQLCGPLLAFVAQLPEPQQRALEVSLGLKDGDLPTGCWSVWPFSRCSVRPATTGQRCASSMMRSGSTRVRCRRSPSWQGDSLRSRSSWFAARRAGAEQELRGHPKTVLAGLNGEESQSLLMSVLPGPLDEYVKDNLLAEAKGNPLALLELHRALTPAELAGGYGLATATNPHALESSFCRRLSALPRQTLLLLLLAAADPAGRPEWLRAAAKRLGISVDAADAAEAEGLITVEDGIRFRHPLIRSAIYRSASFTDRRAAHTALAAVITGPSADDYRAWHRSHGTLSDDDEVADDLEHSAERARGRGGAAAEAKLDAGLPRAALPLITTVEAATDDETLTARAELIRAKAAFAASRGADAPALLLSAAARLAHLDSKLSRETYLQAVTASILVGRCATDATNTPSAVAKAAKMAPPPSQPPRAVDHLLDGLVVRLTEGHRAAAPKLKEAISAYMAEVENRTADPRWHDITHRVCLDVFDIETYNFLAERQLEQLRIDGALTVLPLALQTYSGIAVTYGNFTRAAMLLDESQVITSATGAPLPGCVWAYLAAYRGQEKECREIVETTISLAEQRGEGFDIDGALYSAAILHLGLSQYPEALAAASSARQHDDVGVQTHILNELVEAAARCGERSIAKDAADELQQQAQVCGTDTALGMAARAVALVSDGPSADTKYRTAIDHLQRSPFVVYLPRAHLVYGEWLRREKRRAEARVQLRTAYDSFVQMRADGFANRARRELRATGEPVLARSHSPNTGLTTQEAQIATLARDGYTNSEIAEQLYISPRTVEWHLNHIFGKLNITSRRQLRHKQFDAT
jgi:DNA-binding CsgD family transcriptional regulator